MIQTHPNPSQLRASAWQMIAAALILLSMPVNYRGGAELPHPHAFFQFWSSGDADAFDHHGRRLTKSPSHPVGISLFDDSGASSSIQSIVPRSDTPLLSEMSWPAERADGLAIVLFVALLGMAFNVRLLRVEARRSIPTGRRPNPETPPPRLS